MFDKADVLARVCEAFDTGRKSEASLALKTKLPFVSIAKSGRKSTEKEMMRVFKKDGFIDRYSGRKLIFPGTLRLISHYFEHEFPISSALEIRSKPLCVLRAFTND